MTIFVPKKNTSAYNMYVYAYYKEKWFDEKANGTYFITEGHAVIIYKFYHSDFRKCSIVTDDFKESNGMEIAGIKEKAYVQETVKGREIDILKNALFKLQKLYTRRIYKEMHNDFWYELYSHVLEAKRKKRLIDYDQLKMWVESYKADYEFAKIPPEQLELPKAKLGRKNKQKEAKKIIEYNQAMSIRALSKKYNISRNTLLKYSKNTKMSIKELIDELVTRNENKISAKEIMDMTGFSRNTVYKYLREIKTNSKNVENETVLTDSNFI